MTTTIGHAVARYAAIPQWSSIVPPGTALAEGDWLAPEQLHDADALARYVDASCSRPMYHSAAGMPRVVATYLYRELVRGPLGFAGYMWAAERRVPALDRAFRSNASCDFRQWSWDKPSFAVTRDDELPGSTDSVRVVGDLDAALVEEVVAYCKPLVSAFSRCRYMAPAHAWASSLDALSAGMTLAGRHSEVLDLDSAWARWEELVQRFPLELPRLPRRFIYEATTGCIEEAFVRSGCCLWYQTPSAKAGVNGLHACTTCYLTSDAERTRQLRALSATSHE